MALAEKTEENVIGWECPSCTFINFPSRPGCEMCASERPAAYLLPTTPYNKCLTEIEWEENDRASELDFQQYRLHDIEINNRIGNNVRQQINTVRDGEIRPKITTRIVNEDWLKVIEMDNQPLTPNEEDFECPICMEQCEKGAGVKLKECFHTLCRDCLAHHIQNSEDPNVQCPTNDCCSLLQEREIRELVSEDGLAKYHARCVSRAETSSNMTFHCKTPDCVGWCYYEDEVNVFFCQVCKAKNCITCRAIHATDCETYQRHLAMRAKWDEEAKITQDYLQELIDCGDAMRCPRCAITITKKEGCDWMSCTMCFLEICWATKGPRWGPNGRYDTSGGCKCRINGGPKCHPACINCH